MKTFENSTKIPIITDTHFGAKSFSKLVYENMMLFFEKQFFPWCLENNVKNVIHCGDLVHNRNMIDLWINEEIKTRFFQWFDNHNINLHILVGNHDTYYKTTLDRNYLSKNATEFKNVHVYEQQEKIQIGKYSFLMVPWIIDPEKFKFMSSADVCCGHFDMVGFNMTKERASEEGFEVKEFKDYQQVFSGHYHIHSKRKNVHYVGSQYQITWNDFEETKGFYFLDEQLKPKFIENIANGKFVKLYYDEVNDKQQIKAFGIKKGKSQEVSIEEALTLASSNYCKLFSKHVENQTLFDTFYQSLTTVSRDSYKIEHIDTNEVIESFNVDEIEKEILEESDTITITSNFIESMNFEEDIDKNLLIKLFSSLYRESSELVIEE